MAEGSEKEVEKVFNRIDADGDGKISESELKGVVKALDSSVSQEEVGMMMREMDKDHNGFVDLKEFTEFQCGGGGGRSEGGGEVEDELRDAFKMYDLDKDGVISAKELHLVLKKLGDKSSIGDCARMIKSVDSDGDGCVSFEEFKKMMNKGSHERGQSSS
ncbi:calcium-binding protein CML protein [Dioscorea alata]|uniref:Calcium-binding protein CML protein n=1 Tax=Dioscorea alata TaxID=55571 RepID=A0ACB7U6K6_DIOAL|nr:calcium-binding protein CML protein [Dioscorea alata]